MKKFVKKNSFTKRMVALMLVLLMLATLIPSDLSLKAEGEGGNTLFDGTSITMSSMIFDATYKDENGKDVTVTVVPNDMTELPANATINLMMNFLLQDGSLVQADKAYVYNVPKGIRVDSNVTLPLKMDGEDDPIGNVVISKDGTLTFYFDTDVIGNNKGVGFYVGFGGGLSEDLDEKDEELKIQFPTGGGTFDFDIKSKGDITPDREDEGPNAVINKSGNFVTGTDGKQYVEWTVSLRNKNGDVIEGNIIDNLPTGLTYAGETTVNGIHYPSITGNTWNYNAENGAPRMEVTTPVGGTSVNIHVENCKPDYETKVTFLTVVDDSVYGPTIDGNTNALIENQATFNPPGEEGVTSNKVELKKKPNVLSKAKGNVDADGNVEWTVTVNADRLDIGGTTISDSWDNGTLVGNTITVQKADGTAYGNANVAGNGFTFNVPDPCTDTLIIKYKTHITSMEEDSVNTVELKGGKDPEYNRTESATVPKANLLQKQGLGYDPISQIATWRITVNESGRPLKQVKVEDVFPGDFFDKDTVSVSISPSVGSVGNVTAASENPYGYSDPQGITINLGDIEDTVYITVSMKIKPKDKEDWYTFKNAAILTSPTIATKRVPAEFNAAIEKVKLASKSGKKTDNKEGYITWTIEVKGQKQRPEGYTIKDYLPENMEFVQGSFRVQNQWYDGNPSYKPQVTVISTGQDGQPIAKPYIEYTFTAEDARFLDTVGNGGAFWIQYETRVKDVNDAQKSTTYTNNADVTAKFPNNVVVSEKENASVTETLGGILGKEYAYKQGTNEVTWIVKINEAKTDMSAIKNPTIKDQLEDYLEYKAGSGKLYLVSTNGTRTEVPDTNYQVVVVNNLVTVVLPNISTNYYEFEFTTRFTKGAGDMSQIKVNNKVDLVGDGVVAHKQTSDVTNINFNSAVAGASVKRQIRVRKVDASSGKALEGATFELYLPGKIADRDVLIGKAVTDKDGYAIFEETDTLLGATLKLKETETPPGYDYLATTTNTGDIISEDGVTTIKNFTEANLHSDINGLFYEIVIPNRNESDVTTADIRLKKVDKNKTTTVLPNAVYGLYTDEACTTLKGVTKATDNTGYVTFGNIPEGTYWLKEVTPPDGYKLSNQKVKVEVIVNKTATPATVSVKYDGADANEVTVTDDKATGKFTITKVESGSKTNAKIAGVTFEIYKDEACTLLVASATTDANGIAEFTDLELGRTYWYKEASAPDKYVLDATVRSVKVGTGTENTDQSKKVTVYNSLKLGNIVLTKQDDSIPARRLEGVEFTLWNADDNGNATTAYTKADGTNYVITTNKDGMATFEDIPFGNYVVKETKGKTNYIVSADTAITVNKTGDTTRTIINKAERFTVTIDKKDNTVPVANPLQGAEFTLYNKDGVAVRTGITDKNGRLVFENIPLRDYTGDYTLKETQTPDGYITAADKTITYTQIKAATKVDDVYQIYFTNTSPNGAITDEKQAGKVLLRKVDENGDALAGAEYVIMDEDGNIVKTTTSAADGSISFEDLKWGTYYIVETKAPVFNDKVYVRDETKYKVVVNSNDVTVNTTVARVGENGVEEKYETSEFKNEIQKGGLPFVSFKFKKIDNATPANPISGAVFKLYKNVDPAANPEGFVDTGITGVSGGGTIETTGKSDGMVYFRRVSVEEDPEDTIYRIVETQTLFGYKKSDIKYEITKKEFEAYSKTYVDDDEKNENPDIKTRPDNEINYLPTANATGHLTGIENVSTTSGLTVINEKLYGSIQLTKQGATSNVKLAGAHFTICKEDGTRTRIEYVKNGKTVSDYYDVTTNAQGIALFENLPFGTYYIKEFVTGDDGLPDGYILNEKIIRVEVNQESSKGAIPVTVADARISLYISKQELGVGTEVSGATLVIKEKTGGKIIDQWVSGTDPRHVNYSKLKVGVHYYLEETVAPDGYGYTKKIEFWIKDDGTIGSLVAVQDGNYSAIKGDAIILYDGAVNLTVIKVEKDAPNKPISGARLAIYDDADNEVYRWTTGETGDCDVGAKLTVPKSGYKVYTIKERFAPMAYMLAEPIQFAVDADAKVYEYANGTLGTEITDGKIVMKDAKKSGAFFRKVDAETYADIKGAKLAIYDVADGKTVREWTSDGTPEHFAVTSSTPSADDDLVVGKTYEFRELVAPKGYAEAMTVTFKITGIDAEGKAVIEVLENGNDDSLNHDNDTLLMHDKKVTLKIKKQDTFGMYLPGAELEVYEYDFDAKKAGTKLQTITTGKTTAEVDNTKLKLDGYYLIKETVAPDGFGYADDIVVHIKEDGVAEAVMTISRNDGAFKYDELPTVYENVVYVTDIDNVVSIGKLDADELMNGKNVRVANSVLKLTSDNDRFFEEVVWSSSDRGSEPFDMLKFTPGCTYTLTEIGAPDGYAYTDPINFRIDADTRDVYILNDDGTEEIADNRTVYISDAKINLNVAKVDMLSGESVAGAKFRIVDADGAVVVSWTSRDKADSIDTSKLKAGDPEYLAANADYKKYAEYTIQEVEPPVGYEKAADVTFAIDGDGKMYNVTVDENGQKQYELFTVTVGGVYINLIKVLDEPKLKISKVDIMGKEVPKATLTIYAKDGSVDFEPITWSTGETVGEPKYISKNVFTPNVEYVLEETVAPNGYAYAHNITFYFDEDGMLYVDGVPMDGSRKINMVDESINVVVSKQDEESLNEIKGASLAIRDSKGEAIYTFESDVRPTLLPSDLFVAEKGKLSYYTLEELIAPEGYLMAAPVKFAIDEYGVIYIADENGEYKPATATNGTVVMKDARDPDYSSKIKGPNTGDNMPIIPIAILCIAALGGIIILVIRRKFV